MDVTATNPLPPLPAKSKSIPTGATLAQHLYSNVANVRNICVLAHVDHGKTTLSDCLLSANGVISQKMAGKVRYLDSREDEQQRQITMKASSIALTFTLPHEEMTIGTNAAPSPTPSLPIPSGTQFLINLVDSPGHVDFSSEVSSAVRISDGALLVIDAVEGLCIQTMAVMRQAWFECVRCVLIINKIDRLIHESKMDAVAAYEHMRRILTSANAYMAELQMESVMERSGERGDCGDDVIIAKQSTSPATVGTNGGTENVSDGATDVFNLIDDDGEYFAPERGNVIFASALDGWGFSTFDFASLLETKVGMNARVLKKTLWGDYYYSPKLKKILTSSQLHKEKLGNQLKPMFVTFVLENVWKVCKTILESSSSVMAMENALPFIKALNLQGIPDRELKNKEPSLILQTIMSKWLPLSTSVLLAVVRNLPSPLEAQSYRLKKLWPLAFKQQKLSHVMTNEDKDHFETIIRVREESERCNQSSDVVVVFVSKMFAVDALPEDHSGTVDVLGSAIAATAAQQSDRLFIAFARVFCGTLRAGSKLFAIHGGRVTPIKVDKLYLLMGRYMEVTTQVPAGNVCGIGGLGGDILKRATLSTLPYCPEFVELAQQAYPIVRVAIEPRDPLQLSVLIQGLKQLHRLDPSLDILIQSSGEHVMCTQGELHLERCLKDLKERFAPIDVIVSPPLVAFRETIIPKANGNTSITEQLTIDGFVITKKHIEFSTTDGSVAFRLRVDALPNDVTDMLLSHAREISLSGSMKSYDGDTHHSLFLDKNFLITLEKSFLNAGRKKWLSLKHRLWCCGPKQTGPNLLVIGTKLETSSNPETLAIWKLIQALLPWSDDDSSVMKETLLPEDDSELLYRDIINGISSGFQIATAGGPLCDEPMEGVVVSIEMITIKDVTTCTNSRSLGRLSGLVTVAVRDGIRHLLRHSGRARLLEPLYECDIQTNIDVLGKVYAVLGRRRARILQEDIKEGTQVYWISCMLPVAESFGFAEELRSKTSGGASPQLRFSRWELLDLDPFWVPTTEDELEEYGETGSDMRNLSRRYIDDVRRRKGLYVEEQIVKNAEKQRTLSRKK